MPKVIVKTTFMLQNYVLYNNIYFLIIYYFKIEISHKVLTNISAKYIQMQVKFSNEWFDHLYNIDKCSEISSICEYYL